MVFWCFYWRLIEALGFFFRRFGFYCGLWGFIEVYGVLLRFMGFY